ncbi:DNA-binding transcriptional regulator, GntR family [Lentzea fradiae]|uniref:DNA-binding transcriptional regulator, GntR family n=1 Tax=Lentzea fradiae TaxID=200378 RepID=A0A1G7KCV0_9PSEU|nr:GntR family transcriptional regulator [Lentzea fradiae]SDF34659.1 DNA-binding transcriptional regulator, GntR family [Lentzea fradiae]
MSHPSSPATRSAGVQALIRSDILGGRLRPGERLKFPQLSERYGVSTGAVREALLRLSALRLVTSEPHLGFQVRTISQEGLALVCDARAELESLALRRAVAEGGLGWQSRLIAAHHTFRHTPYDPESQDWLDAHTELHHVLLSGCANPLLREAAEALRDEAELYRRWARPAPGDTDLPDREELARAHQDLVTAAVEGDADGAEARLREMIALTARLQVRLD